MFLLRERFPLRLLSFWYEPSSMMFQPFGSLSVK